MKVLQEFKTAAGTAVIVKTTFGRYRVEVWGKGYYFYSDTFYDLVAAQDCYNKQVEGNLL